MRSAIMPVLLVMFLCMMSSMGLAQLGSTYMSGFDLQRSGVSPYDIEFPPVLAWQHTTSERNPQAPVATPAVGPQTVFVPVGNALLGIDRVTGARKWRLDTGARIFSTPVYHNNTVYVGSDNDELIAVNAATGARSWAIKTGGDVRSSPLVFNNVLYFGSDDRHVYALDINTKQLRWKFQTRGAVRSTPCYYRDKLFVVSADGYLYALNVRTGQQLWNTNIGTRNVFGSPVIERQKVLVAAGDRLLAYDTETGNIRWSFTSAGLIVGSAAIKDRRAYIGSRDGSLYCLDANNGVALWRYPSEGTYEPISSSPSIQGNTIVYRSGARSVLAVDIGPNAGQLVWQYTLPEVKASAQATEAMPGERRGRRGRGPGGMPPGMPGGPEMPPGMPGGFDPGVPGAPGMPGGPGGWDGGRTAPVELKMEDVIDPSPALADNALYILSDDHVVFGFDNTAADNSGPVIREALLDIRGREGYSARYRVIVDRADSFPGRYIEFQEPVPGAPPITLSMVLIDPGSGVDPNSIQVKMDNKAVELTYDMRQGLLWYIYDPRGAAVSLRNGLQNFIVSAADWLGNRTEVQMAFEVDNSLPPPSPPVGAPGTPGMPGEMMPPGFDPGMMPPGFDPGMMPPPPPH